MKKILFLIHDLGEGGAEKVLVNLVNNMDYSKFDVTVMTLFDYGVNRQFLNDKVHYKTWSKKMIKGNSYLMKMLSPKQLHDLIIKDYYDIEVAYLEGPSARVISGCQNKNTKLVSWIHIEQHTAKKGSCSFRSLNEAENCYNKFNKIICVSNTVKQDFSSIFDIKVPVEVFYNTNETNQIIKLAEESVTAVTYDDNVVNLVGVGKLLPNKGFDRMIRIVKQLTEENYKLHLYILGIGPQQKELEKMIEDYSLQSCVTLLGYRTNPYKYVKNCDLFICASHAEGFSTAATEALIVGTPVCTVEVSGMKEMLGNNNEFGIVVNNDDQSLYQGIKYLLDNLDKLKYYSNQALLRGKDFSTEQTVRAVENMLLSL